MPRLFLSYASQDRDRVRPLVTALEQDGYSVWWDREIKPGPSFDREIERAINEADCLVVVWSASSVESEWVRSEVDEGARRNILVPVVIDDGLPPLAYRRRQAADLSDWWGGPADEYQQLLLGIEATVAGSADADASAGDPPGNGAKQARRQQRPRRRGRGVTLGQGVAALAVLALIFALGVILRPSLWPVPTPSTAGVSRLEIPFPDGMALRSNLRNPLTISPDGRRLVLAGSLLGGRTEYFVRDLDDLNLRKAQGFDDIPDLGSLWLSPDGEWIIFNDIGESAFRKLRLDGGGLVQVVANGGGTLGLSWGPAGDIVYTASENPNLMIIAQQDAQPAALTTAPEGHAHMEPRHLPDGQALVYVETNIANNDSKIRIRNLRTGDDRVLLDGSAPQVTASGHLLFIRDRALWGTAMDLDALDIVGRPAPVLEDILDINVRQNFDVSSNGTLVYVPYRTNERIEELVWLDRDGSVQPVPLPMDSVVYPRLSPDDSQLVFMAYANSRRADLWTHTFDADITTRLTFNNLQNIMPIWTADGLGILYSAQDASVVNNQFRAYLRPADGAPQEQLILAEEGKTVFVRGLASEGSQYLLESSTTGFADKKLGLVAAAAPNAFDRVISETLGFRLTSLSPDDAWLAYDSAETGTEEVFVLPLADVAGEPVRVSRNGGTFPFWSRSGPDLALYYVEEETNTLMRVQVTQGRPFSASPPTPHFDLTGYVWRTRRGGVRNFDLNLAGDRILAVRLKSSNSGLVVVQNWFQELERLLPTGD